MQTTNNNPPISAEFLEILRCPLAVQEKAKYGDDPGRLDLVRGSWLVSRDSGLKYPIRDGIPVMLIEEGMRWKDTAIDDLPVPPPAEAAVAPAMSDAAPATPTATGQKGSAARGNGRKLLIVLVAVIALVVFLRHRK